MLIADRQQHVRFASWIKLREHLEKSNDPLRDVSSYFLKLPRVKFYTDPYSSITWPTPWELIDENEYCEFNIILGICYTLQLTVQWLHNYTARLCHAQACHSFCSSLLPCTILITLLYITQ